MKPSWHWSNKPPEERAKIIEVFRLKGLNNKPNSGSFKVGYKSPRKGKKLGWIGHSTPHSEETKNKISLSKIGHTPWNKGKVGVMPTPWNKGTHGVMPEPPNKGQGVGASLGIAIRGLPEYVKWRLAVFTRDNFTCQHCGAKGVKLHADHIKPFALICRENNIDSKDRAIACKALWSIKNGQTLCIPCHKKTETFSGKQQTKLYRFPRS